MKNICAAILVLTLMSAAGADGAVILDSPTGLANPAETITFDEVVLVDGTALTNQFAGFGVTFSGLSYSLDPFTLGDLAPPMARQVGFGPVSIFFNAPQTDVALAFVTNPTNTIMTALLKGVVVETFVEDTVMIYHGYYEASEVQIAELIASQIAGRLITVGSDGTPHVGVFPFVQRADGVEWHLAEGDEQLADLRRGSSCVFEIGDVLAFIPSYWEDEHSAAGADIYHRTVVLEGRAELVADPGAVAGHLQRLLSRYQPEGRYVDVEADHELYAKMLRRLTLVRLSVSRARSKFKLGQQRPASIRQHVIGELRQRNRPADGAAADAVASVTPT